MYRRILPAFLIAASVAANPLQAQVTTDTAAVVATCPDTVSAKTLRVCNAALDGITMLHPLAALLLGGGNPVIGTAAPGAGGKFGHFRIAYRAIRTGAVIPDLEYDGTDDTVKVNRRLRLYSQHLDISAGLLQKKMPMGTVAVDFLLSALIIPKGVSLDFRPVAGSRSVGTNAVQLDWGIRAGLVSPKYPLASLSIVKRGMPTGTVGHITKDDLSAYVFNATAMNIRLFLGKNTKHLEFAVGAGADMMGGKAVVYYKDPDTGDLQEPLEAKLSGMRLVTALNIGAVVGPLRITGEGGYQAASAMGLKTIFAENDTNAGRFFAGMGLSVVF